MNDKQQQIRNTIIYLLPLVLNAVIPFVTLPVFTRLLSVQDFGVLALAQVYGIFAGGIATFGMSTAYERNFFKYMHDPSHSGQLLLTSIAFVTVTFATVGIASYFLLDMIAEFFIRSTGHANMVMWALVVQYAVTINLFFMIELKNSERAVRYSIAFVSTTILNLIISLSLVVWVETGVIGLLYAQAMAYIGVSLVLWMSAIRRYRFSFNYSCLIESFKIGLPLTPRIFLGVINTQFDKFMIGMLASVGGVGIYEIGQKVSRAVFTCMTAIQNVYSPRVYKQMFELRKEGGYVIGRYLTPFAYLSIGFALGAALVAEELITVLTPPAFHSAIDIVIILSMYYGFLFFGKINGNQIIFMKKTGITSVLTMVAIALNILLNIPLILKWGALGAAWGTMLAGLISGLLSFRVAQRLYAINWEYRHILSILSVLYLTALVLLILRVFAVDYWIVVIFKAVISGLYIYLGNRIGILKRENMVLAANFFKGFSLKSKAV